MGKNIFLEAHNSKNLTSGFGIFNYSLLKAFSELETPDLDFYVNLKRGKKIQEELGSRFFYTKYNELQRHWLFRPKKVYDVWHSLNQNIKVEPFFKQKKYILTVHDVNFAEAHDAKNRKRCKLFREKMQRADLITYISQYARDHTYEFFDVPKREERIIYNGNPVTGFLETSDFQPNVPVNIPYFYTVGDFLEKKNFISLVRMMKIMPDFNLIISGNKDKEYGAKVKEEIMKEKLQQRVFLTGKVSEQGKQYFMRNCVAFLFPSVGEGFGLPPIEAMKFGKPVFLARRASLPEIGADAAFYWDDFDPVYMKEILENGLNNFSAQEDFFSKKIKERADYFSWTRAAKEYIDCYR